MYYLYKDAHDDYILIGPDVKEGWYETATEALDNGVVLESDGLLDAVHPLLLVASGKTRDAIREKHPELFI